MTHNYQIPEPFQFNPMKHHLRFIREYLSNKLSEEKGIDIKTLVRELRRIGSSVMDIYTGKLSVDDIGYELKDFLVSNKVTNYEAYSEWTGKHFSCYREVTLSDSSRWMLKLHNDESRYVHIFPARMSPHSFRVKANTLKSAMSYYVLIGKDFISADDLNRARAMLGLSPIKDPDETEAIIEMIEILRL